MSNLIFIKETVYALKIEYGEAISINRRSVTQDQRTGQKVTTVDSFNIQMAIPLPENLREAFLKTVGIKKEGRLAKGEREFLIDKSDIPSGKVIDRQCFIKFTGPLIAQNADQAADVTAIDDYLYAMIVTVVGITGMPTS